MVGSDIENYKCVYCKSNDRERHLKLYVDKIGFWNDFKLMKVLHFAPENHFCKIIESKNPKEYIKADLNPKNSSIHQIDITKIPFEDNYFDIIIANHILEHVVDYNKAISEIFRVLKSPGKAILQTPYSQILNKHFEDTGINTDELRLVFHGQEDHVRTFSHKLILKDFVKHGFKLNIVKHSEVASEEEARIFGVNKNEDLVLLGK